MVFCHRRAVAATAIVVLAALGVLVQPAPAAAEASLWVVDSVHSNFGFTIRHFVSRVPGRFNDVSGTIVYDPQNPTASSVELVAQAASIDTKIADRDNHLRSADFFDVEKYPTLSFKSTAVKAAGGGLEVTGELSIRGVTKRITVPVEVLGVMGKKAGFEATFTIDRTDYGVAWNRAAEGGGFILGDIVQVTISIEANRQEPEPAAEAKSR